METTIARLREGGFGEAGKTNKSNMRDGKFDERREQWYGCEEFGWGGELVTSLCLVWIWPVWVGFWCFLFYCCSDGFFVNSCFLLNRSMLSDLVHSEGVTCKREVGALDPISSLRTCSSLSTSISLQPQQLALTPTPCLLSATTICNIFDQ